MDAAAENLPDVLDSAAKWLSSIYNVMGSEGAIRNADIAVFLKSDAADNGNAFVFIGNEDEGVFSGEVREVGFNDYTDLRGQKDHNFFDHNLFSQELIEPQQNLAARNGAEVIMKNLAVYNAGGYGKLPFDPEHPEKARAAALPEIKDALWNLRGDLMNGASEPSYADGEYAGQTIKDADAGTKIESVEAALKGVELAINLPGYRVEIRNALDDNPEIKDQLGNYMIKDFYGNANPEDADNTVENSGGGLKY